MSANSNIDCRDMVSPRSLMFWMDLMNCSVIGKRMADPFLPNLDNMYGGLHKMFDDLQMRFLCPSSFCIYWRHHSRCKQFSGRNNRRGRTCGPCYTPKPSCDTTTRIDTSNNMVSIFAYPSTGGIIVLENANAVDIDFLGLDLANIRMVRAEKDSEEDEFCRQILLLGAKWWPSVDGFYSMWQYCDCDLSYDVRKSQQAGSQFPSESERCRVFVGWPSTGGFWTAEFKPGLPTCHEDEDKDTNFVLQDTVLLGLARNMDERCYLLRDRFDANFYNDLSEYHGPVFKDPRYRFAKGGL
jgi:hypothetical protein